MDFKSGLPPHFGLSWIVTIHEISLFARFSNWISFILAKQPNANLPIGFGSFAKTSPVPFKMLHLSHSTRIVSKRWKTMSKERKMFIHSFVDSLFKTSFNVSSNCYRQQVEDFDKPRS
jgi:hypothetical protein